LKKIVLDTNVFISGVLFNGNCRIILNEVIEGKLKLFISEKILIEVADVLSRKKFDFPPEIIRHIITEIEQISEFVSPKIEHKIISKDPDDNMIIDCAVESTADYIISGDNHLLEIKSYKNIKIISPRDFLDNTR